MASWLGWLATALVVSSYFAKDPTTLRRIQGVGALVWMAYGVAIHAIPIIAANVLVAAAAVWSSFARAPAAVSGQSVATREPLARDQA